MSHKHSVHDTDRHFLINPVSREIIPQSEKNRLMQNDHNSERFTFQIPRYVEGHDMSLCDRAYVHYVNASTDGLYQSSGPYLVSDVQVSPDDDEVVIFSWLLSNNTTRYAGFLYFAVGFSCVDENSAKVTYDWHTDVHSSIVVDPSLINSTDELVLEFEQHDIIRQLLDSVYDAEGSILSRINSTAADALNDISNSCQTGLQNITEAKDQVIDEIESIEINADSKIQAIEDAADNSLTLIAEAKDQAVGEIENIDSNSIIQAIEEAKTEALLTIENVGNNFEVASKVSLPTDKNGLRVHGAIGQFAVSDGKGGITWIDLLDAEEVTY